MAYIGPSLPAEPPAGSGQSIEANVWPLSGTTESVVFGRQSDVPHLSVIIPVRNDPAGLAGCLRSLAIQRDAPPLEILVIDDGSVPSIEEVLPPARWPCGGRLVRQVALGVSAARNRGVAEARGDAFVFVDSDVVLDACALAELKRALVAYPGDPVFQARLDSGCRGLAQRMERLRLRAVQRILQTPDGHIGYLNTSACTIRRTAVTGSEFFPVSAIRGEDTHQLARLAAAGQRPRFVAGAAACHRPGLSLPRYLLKHLAIGFHTRAARAALRRAKGPLLHMPGRWRMFSEIWRMARASSHDQVAAVLIVAAFALECLGRLAARAISSRSGPARIFSLRLDVLNASEIISRVLDAVRRQRGLTITYFTAWTLVRANRSRSMSAVLRSFDLCYADGMGVVVALRLLNGTSAHKVTANDFFLPLCQELTLQSRSIGLVGGKPGTIELARQVLLREVHDARIILSSHGFLSHGDRAELRSRLAQAQPDVLFLGLGQPLQEEFVTELRAALPRTVFFCVGGLFDYLAGLKPTPPALVRRLGFEWLFLLLSCPRRFGYRYLVGLPLLGIDIVRHHLDRLAGGRAQPAHRATGAGPTDLRKRTSRAS